MAAASISRGAERSAQAQAQSNQPSTMWEQTHNLVAASPLRQQIVSAPSYRNNKRASESSTESVDSLESNGQTNSAGSFYTPASPPQPQTQQQPQPQSRQTPPQVQRARAVPSNEERQESQTTPFYVPVNTPCWVSCGDGCWHEGIWGDNQRSVHLVDQHTFRYQDLSNMSPSALREIHSRQTFIRHADVLLLDAQGPAMFMAANRKRPCLVRFPANTRLYREESRGNFVALSSSNLF